MKKNIIFIFLITSALLLSACENEKIKPGFVQKDSSNNAVDFNSIITVEQSQIVQIYEAVGTIRPLTESVIESQVSAKVLKVSCSPGVSVKKGDLLIKLDGRQLNTQLKQAQEGLSVAQNRLNQTHKSVDEAKAGLDQAKAAFQRTEKLFKSGVVPSQQLEIDKAAYLKAKAVLENSKEASLTAKATIRQAQEIVNEAQIALGYSFIKSPAAGIVVKKMIDPGDLAVPGKPLLIIQTSGSLRLEANVREGLIKHVNLKNEFKVRIGTIDKTVSSTIEEIVPYADPSTRTFLVKALLPATPGIYPGMFGRLLIPVGKENTLLIPQKAVVQVGQLELVNLKVNDQWETVYIKTGKTFGEKIEVLAGLLGNETIGYK